jgi:hypothetical protein
VVPELVRDSIEKHLGFRAPPRPSFFHRTSPMIRFGDATYRLLVEFLVPRGVLYRVPRCRGDLHYCSVCCLLCLHLGKKRSSCCCCSAVYYTGIERRRASICWFVFFLLVKNSLVEFCYSHTRKLPGVLQFSAECTRRCTRLQVIARVTRYYT